MFLRIRLTTLYRTTHRIDKFKRTRSFDWAYYSLHPWFVVDMLLSHLVTKFRCSIDISLFVSLLSSSWFRCYAHFSFSIHLASPSTAPLPLSAISHTHKLSFQTPLSYPRFRLLISLSDIPNTSCPSCLSTILCSPLCFILTGQTEGWFQNTLCNL